MPVPVALLATAAATVGAVSALRAIRQRVAEGERRVEAVRRRQAVKKEAERREANMIDLEPDSVTGVYGMKRAERLGGQPRPDAD